MARHLKDEYRLFALILKLLEFVYKLKCRDTYISAKQNVKSVLFKDMICKSRRSALSLGTGYAYDIISFIFIPAAIPLTYLP